MLSQGNLTLFVVVVVRLCLFFFFFINIFFTVMLFVFFLFHFLFSLPSPLLLHALRILCVNPVVLCEHSKRLTPDGRTGGSSSSSAAAAADVIAVNKKRTIYSFIHFSFLSKLSKVKLEGNDAAQLSSAQLVTFDIWPVKMGLKGTLYRQ